MSPVLILARTHRLHTRNPINNANVYYVRENRSYAQTQTAVCVCAMAAVIWSLSVL
jgi:hypothetical protein